MEKYQVFAKWSKEFGDKVASQYPYCKKIYLSRNSNYKSEWELIDALNKNSIFETFTSVEKFEIFIMENSLFSYAEGIVISIRNAIYTIKNGNIRLEDCVVILFCQDETWYNTLINELPEREIVGDFTLTFPKKAGCEELKQNTRALMEKISNQPLTVDFDKSILNRFFQDAIVLYCGTITPEEIRILQNATDNPYFFTRRKKKKVLFLFTSSEPIDIEQISKMLTDSLFYMGAHSYSDYTYGTCIDPTCSGIKIDILVVTEGDE